MFSIISNFKTEGSKYGWFFLNQKSDDYIYFSLKNNLVITQLLKNDFLNFSQYRVILNNDIVKSKEVDIQS